MWYHLLDKKRDPSPPPPPPLEEEEEHYDSTPRFSRANYAPSFCDASLYFDHVDEPKQQRSIFAPPLAVAPALSSRDEEEDDDDHSDLFSYSYDVPYTFRLSEGTTPTMGNSDGNASSSSLSEMPSLITNIDTVTNSAETRSTVEDIDSSLVSTVTTTSDDSSTLANLKDDTKKTDEALEKTIDDLLLSHHNHYHNMPRSTDNSVEEIKFVPPPPLADILNRSHDYDEEEVIFVPDEDEDSLGSDILSFLRGPGSSSAWNKDSSISSLALAGVSQSSFFFHDTRSSNQVRHQQPIPEVLSLGKYHPTEDPSNVPEAQDSEDENTVPSSPAMSASLSSLPRKHSMSPKKLDVSPLKLPAPPLVGISRKTKTIIPTKKDLPRHPSPLHHRRPSLGMDEPLKPLRVKPSFRMGARLEI